MSNYVDGKVIIITGAAGGFGRLVSQKTAALGVRVVASDVNETGLKVTADSVIAGGGRIESVVADVTDLDQMTKLAAQPDSASALSW